MANSLPVVHMEMFLNCSTNPRILISSLFINNIVWWEIRLDSVIVCILQTNQIAPGCPHQEDLHGCPTELESVGKMITDKLIEQIPKNTKVQSLF